MPCSFLKCPRGLLKCFAKCFRSSASYSPERARLPLKRRQRKGKGRLRQPNPENDASSASGSYFSISDPPKGRKIALASIRKRKDDPKEEGPGLVQPHVCVEELRYASKYQVERVVKVIGHPPGTQGSSSSSQPGADPIAIGPRPPGIASESESEDLWASEQTLREAFVEAMPESSSSIEPARSASLAALQGSVSDLQRRRETLEAAVQVPSDEKALEVYDATQSQESAHQLTPPHPSVVETGIQATSDEQAELFRLYGSQLFRGLCPYCSNAPVWCQGIDHPISSNQETIEGLKMEVKNLAEENRTLLCQLSTSEQQRQELKTCSEKVLKDYESMMKYVNDSKEQHYRDQQEISSLKEILSATEVEKQRKEEEITLCHIEMEHLRSEHAQLNSINKALKRQELKSCSQKVIKKYETMKKYVQQSKEQHDRHQEEISSLKEILRAMELEKQRKEEEIALCRTELEHVHSEQEHLHSINKALKRKYGEKILYVTEQWKQALKDVETAHNNAEKLYTLAKNSIQDRRRLLVLGSETMAAESSEDFTQVTEQEEEQLDDMLLKKRIRHLQRQLRNQEKIINQVREEKKDLEQQLEIAWETSTNELRRQQEHFMECLRQDRKRSSRAEESL